MLSLKCKSKKQIEPFNWSLSGLKGLRSKDMFGYTYTLNGDTD